MLKLRNANVLMLVQVLFAQTAHAFFDAPWVTPAAPLAGEAVTLHIPTGVCDGIFGREGYPQVTRNGNAIRILEYGHHYDAGDELCIYPIATPSDVVGAFPAGRYTLTAQLAYYDSFDEPAILTIGTLPLDVVDPLAAATPLPINGAIGLWAQLLSLPGVAAWMLRPRRRGSGSRSAPLHQIVGRVD